MPSISASRRTVSLFLMGARKGHRLPDYPARTHELPSSNLKLGFTETTPTVWEAIDNAGDHHFLRTKPASTQSARSSGLRSPASETARLMSRLPAGIF